MRRAWFWGVVAAAVLVVGALAVALSAVQLRWSPYPPVLYEEDFSDGAGRFDVWDDADGAGWVEDGRFYMTVRSTPASQAVFIPLRQVASNVVTVEATMGLAGRDEAAAFGVFAGRDGGAYVDLVVDADGTARVRGAPRRCPTVELDPASKGQVLRLEVSWTPGEAQSFSAFVDGREVIQCEASSADAPFGFVEAGVFAIAGADHPVTVVVDDFYLFAASG